MIPVHQTDGLRFRTAFQHLRRAFQRQVFDQYYAVAIDEHIAVGILHHARFFRLGSLVPLVTTRDTLPFLRKVQNIVHFAHRADWFAH